MDETVKNLVKYVVETFAENKEDIAYEIEEKEAVTEITVRLNPADLGTVIGKQGKIAKALRTLVSATTPRGAKRCTVEIKEKEN